MTMNQSTPHKPNRPSSSNRPGKHAGQASTSRPAGAHAGTQGRNRERGRNLQAQPDASSPLVTRRQLLYGAAGVGAAAAIGVGAFAATRAAAPPETEEEPAGTTKAVSADDVHALNVPADAVTPLADFEALDTFEGRVNLVSDHELPYGTLLWMNDDSVAACLLPTESGSPLAQIGLLHLASGADTTVLERAIGTAEHFEIYDVRATSEGMVWTEANVMKGAWRIYTARLTGDVLGEPQLAEEGGDTYDTPTIAAVGDRAFWQVLPKAPNPDGLTSRLMCTQLGNAGGEQLFESSRRMGTPVYAGEDSVTIAPRLDIPTVYYQLTNIDAATGRVRDQLTLPASMSPLEAGYGKTGFMFSFPDIYDNDSGIANLGTYTPLSKPSGGYDGARWFSFARTPTAAPAWCDDLLIVKSSYSVCGVDLQNRRYFAIDVDNGADTYGEYLASSGVHDTFVTFANIDHTPVDSEATHACRVKVWQVAPEGAYAASEDDAGEGEGDADASAETRLV